MLFPSTLIPAALLFIGAAVVSARPASSELATESNTEGNNYAVSAILRYRQKEKKDVEEIVVGVAE